MHNHLNTPRCKLEVTVSSSENGRLPPFTPLPTPTATPHTYTDTHTHRRTHGEVEQESSVTTSHLSQSPSSRSAAPTSQLSSPNTLHSISAPREWFIDRTASRQRNVLFLFRQLDWKCMLFDSQAWKWAQGGSRLGSVKSPRDGTNEF